MELWTTSTYSFSRAICANYQGQWSEDLDDLGRIWIKGTNSDMNEYSMAKKDRLQTLGSKVDPLLTFWAKV